VFNVGSPDPVSHRDLVTMLIEEAGHGSVKFVEWPEEKRRIDIGSFYSDSTRFAATTGWSQHVPLREGLRRTIAYYRANLAHYLEPS
jgi:UDP-glucose 4-epimerase